jgi:hypothetical protein
VSLTFSSLASRLVLVLRLGFKGQSFCCEEMIQLEVREFDCQCIFCEGLVSFVRMM